MDVIVGSGLVALWSAHRRQQESCAERGDGSVPPRHKKLVDAVIRAVQDGCRAGVRGRGGGGSAGSGSGEAAADDVVSVCVTQQAATTRRLEPWDVHLQIRLET